MMIIDHYYCRGAEVFYLHPIEMTEELFLTVHKTRDCTMTPAEQAAMLAEMLNERIREMYI